MTFIGKLFLMLNLALSLGMMAAGTALYATRTDWTDAPAKGGAPPGALVRKKAELKEKMDTIYPAENSFRVAGTALETLERQRQVDREFYSKELEHVRSTATDKNPANSPEIDGKSGLPAYDAKTGQPKVRPAADRSGQPLESLASYSAKIAQKQKENAAALDELKVQFDLDTKETEKLTGTPMGRGLRQHILDEAVKQAGIVDEIDSTRPLFINTRVEAAIVRERIAALDKQIDSLKQTLEKLKRVDAGR